MKLFEAECGSSYHEHWWAADHKDAAERAFDHAQEIGRPLAMVLVSSMVEPPDWVAGDKGHGGLVYVLNDTRIYTIRHGKVRRVKESR